MLSWIQLNAQSLRDNLRCFKHRSPSAIIAPVLKSNAYGHGLSEVYKILASEDMPWVCVNYLNEASQLRHLGYQGRILVVGPATTSDWDKARHLNADVVVGNLEVLSSWLALPTRPMIHLKFDTGMGRQGFEPLEASNLKDLLLQSRCDPPALNQIAGVCTHFANVEDVTDQSYALSQVSRFKIAQEVFRPTGLPILYHCAASASALILDISHLDLIRIGISLYGLWPSSLTRVSYLQQHKQLLDLTPVLSWHTQITTLKKVPKGQFIGYGCSYRAVRDMNVAVLPVGYFEGYPRIAGEGSSFVLIEGQRCPVVGRICMNMMMVDVTHVDQLKVGTPVTLIGRDGGETITAGDLASWSKTIHYEVLSRLHPDIPRRI